MLAATASTSQQAAGAELGTAHPQLVLLSFWFVVVFIIICFVIIVRLLICFPMITAVMWFAVAYLTSERSIAKHSAIFRYSSFTFLKPEMTPVGEPWASWVLNTSCGVSSSLSSWGGSSLQYYDM